MKLPQLNFSYPTYIVGGWVRDYYLGVESKDLDLCMVAPSYVDMRTAILNVGGEIFLETPEYLTIRCKIPNIGAVDVALARRDGGYSDGRRPDETFVADSIQMDLSRRDCTFNAMAIDLATGELIDPFGGMQDLEDKIIKTVGNPLDRFQEDYLRILRAIRFAITKRFDFAPQIHELISSPDIVNGLERVSVERIREELHRCFKYDTVKTCHYLTTYPHVLYWCVRKGLWFEPTLKK
jgi:tRNA nucleotidyltransferase/poly(A) polymerase